MKARKNILAVVAVLATGVWATAGGIAQAAFPDYSDCPTTAPGAGLCLDIKNTTGSLNIKGFNVPLGESLEIRGAMTNIGEGSRFIPPTGTNGFFSTPIPVPGGLLGIEFPIPGNSVLATTQLAGPASSIVFELGIPVTTISLPVKVKLDNPILGSNCYIGSDRNPARLTLTTGTTSPPLPNRPISGHIGTIRPVIDGLQIFDALSVDNAFAIPGASGCGLLGIFNPLVNLKLKLPSAAGNNTMSITNNIGLRLLEE